MTTMNDLQPPAHEAGWYADPAGAWAWRWFDGNDWTGTVNDGQTNHSDLASLMAVREQLVPAAPMPPAPTASSPSAARKGLRVVGWGVGAVVITFMLLVTVGLVFDLGTEPIAEVEGAEVLGIIPVDIDRHDELWFAVVEPGTTLTELEGIAQRLLDLPEAQDRRISFTFYNSDDELEDYIEFNSTLTGDFSDEDIERAIELAASLDTDAILENTVGYVSWAEDTQEYVVCSGTVELCTAQLAVASFTE